jgi:hypothetical protein
MKFGRGCCLPSIGSDLDTQTKVCMSCRHRAERSMELAPMVDRISPFKAAKSREGAPLQSQSDQQQTLRSESASASPR